MYKALSIFLISLTVLACNGTQEEHPKKSVEQSPAKKKKVLKKTNKKPQRPPNFITNDNIKERLLAYGKENPETIVLIKTSKGNIKVRPIQRHTTSPGQLYHDGQKRLFRQHDFYTGN